MKYQSNPNLPILKRGYRGNKLKNNEFVNVGRNVSSSILTVASWYTFNNPQWIRKPRNNFKLKVVKDTNFIKVSKDVIIWLGHSSFYIRVNGVSLITDPCFDHLPFVRRLAELPFAFDLIKNLDYILISHGHHDHFNKKSIRSILVHNPDVKFLVPLNLGILIKEMNHNNLEEAGWYQKYKTKNNVNIIFLPARHWHKRGFMDDNRMLWGSFLIRSGKKSIYFAGDSAYARHFKDIRRTVGPIDYGLIPIGPYKPRHMMKESHIGPREAVRAFNDLAGKHFIPMHYGTYDLAHEELGDPIRKVRKLNKRGKFKDKLRELKIGENYYL